MRTILLLIIGAGLAASACDTRTNASVVRTDTLPAAKGDILLSLETTVVSSRVRAGATLASMLRAEHVALADIAAHRLAGGVGVRSAESARQPAVPPAKRRTPASVRGFEYEIDGDRFLRVGRSPADALIARVLPIPKTRSVEVVQRRRSIASTPRWSRRSTPPAKRSI